MLSRRSYYLVVVVLLSILTWIACTKEYSYEGGLNPGNDNDTIQIPPTTPPVSELSMCLSCIGQDKYEENRWSFTAGNAFACGIMDTALVNSERTAFTFFGPSSCSDDTSMVVTAYLDSDTLNHNISGMMIDKIIFRYTKIGLPDFLLTTKQGTPFTLTISQYDHTSKMAIGTYQGHAYLPDGSTMMVSGKFMVKLH